MPSPNFSKAQTYGVCYKDNTLYSVVATAPTQGGYLWSFAAAGQQPVYGQFPSLLQQGQFNPCGVRCTLIGDITQGATLQSVLINLTCFGGSIGLTFPTTDFTASATSLFKVVAEFDLLATGALNQSILGHTSVLNSSAVQGFQVNGSNNISPLSAMEAGGTIGFNTSVGAAGPTVNSRTNMIEIFSQ